MSDEPKVETPETPPDTTKQPGLAARLEQVIGERNTLRSELATAKTAAATADATARELADTRAARTAEQASWGEERDLMRAGLLDGEAQDVARVLYARTPEAERPKTIGEWIAAQRADGATPPRALAAYLGGPGSVGAPAPPPKPQGNGKPPPAAGAVTPEALRSAREHYQKTGDLSQMRTLSAAVKNRTA